MASVLVVEDDRDLNRLLCLSLRGGGYRPTACFDGAEALDAFSSTKFDMILTDVMMPHVDGFQLADRKSVV